MNIAKLSSDGTHQMVILPTDFKMLKKSVMPLFLLVKIISGRL